MPDIEMEFPWLATAAKGGPMPEGLCILEQRAFQAMACLYARYRMDMVSKETASLEKQEIITALKRDMEAKSFFDRLDRYYIDLITETERARSRYRKEHSLEAADDMMILLEGRLQRYAQACSK